VDAGRQVRLSKTERPTLRLRNGPPGMALTADGRLEWAVPRDFRGTFATVALVATTADGLDTSPTVYPPGDRSGEVTHPPGRRAAA
jgi:hypothetical protein